MSLLRKLAGETAIYGFSYILSRVLHYLLFTWYLTRVFNNEPGQYGIYRDLYFYVAVLIILLTFRMETTYFRYARDHRPAVTTMSMIFLTGLAGIFLLTVYACRGTFAHWLAYPQLTEHLVLLGWVLFFDVISAIPFATLRQQNRPYRFLFLKLGSIVLNIAFVLFFLEVLPGLSSNGGFWKYIYGDGDKLYLIILGNLLASAITFFLLLPLLKKSKFQWDPAFLGRMLYYAWPLVISGLAGVINQYSSITFQKYFLGSDLTENLAEGGKYAAAASIAIILGLFTTAYNYAAEPFFFAHKDKIEAKKVYADAGLAYTIVASLIMLFILAYIDVFQLLLGRNFRSALDIVPILLIAFLLLGIYYNVSAWYKLADKTLWSAWIALGGTVITVILSIVLIPALGVVGSAWTALACYFFMVAMCYLLGQRFYPVPYQIGRMAGWIAIAILIYFVMEWLRSFYPDQLPVILAVNTALILTYCAAVLFFEKSLLKSVLGRKP